LLRGNDRLVADVAGRRRIAEVEGLGDIGRYLTGVHAPFDGGIDAEFTPTLFADEDATIVV
jgi:hypothetical protein